MVVSLGDRTTLQGAPRNAPTGDSRVGTTQPHKQASPCVGSLLKCLDHAFHDIVLLPYRVIDGTSMDNYQNMWKSTKVPLFYNPHASLKRYSRPIAPQLPIYIREPFQTTAAGCGKPRPP